MECYNPLYDYDYILQLTTIVRLGLIALREFFA